VPVGCILSTDMELVKLKTECQIEVELDGRAFILTRMEPNSWLTWVDGEVEDNAVYLTTVSRDNLDISDEDVAEYVKMWCRESDNTVIKATAGTTKPSLALVQFEKPVGKHIPETRYSV